MNRKTKPRYIDWLINLVCDEDRRRAYSSLFSLLYSIPYRWSIPLDANRSEDGLDLRARYEKEVGEKVINIMSNDTETCNVLEFLIALAIRCEFIISGSFDENTTYKWFWMMIDNMGLTGAVNDDWDEDAAIKIVDNMLDRKYDIDGSHGGLFVVDDPEKDFAKKDIWYQLNAWIISIE